MRTTRPWRSAVLAASLLAVAATPAAAHEGNPDYRSEVHRVTPVTPGLQVQVLDHDDALELTNRSGRAVLVYGYEHEPYARVLADGTVQVNGASATARAAAAEEEDEHAAAGYVLASYDYAHAGEEHGEDGHERGGHEASEHAGHGVRWTTLDKTGRFSWHDDRIKWHEASMPSQVTDESRETKVFDWQVPIRVGAQAGAIDGTLLWVGKPGSGGGVPVAAVVSLIVAALVAVAAVVLVRRRRAAP